MAKILGVIVKRLSIIFLIGLLFLSFSQQALHSAYYNISISYVTSKTSTNLTLEFSTFLGGNDLDHGYGIAVTKEEQNYVTGITESNDFPSKNAFNSTLGGNLDGCLTKFAANNSLLWSTFLGGNNLDRCFAIDVADDGSCYVIGDTDSNDFPTKNAFNSTLSGDLDIFITKFSSNGSLLWSTYFGGNSSEFASGIAVTNDGSCYVTGVTSSVDFPTKNASDPSHNGSLDAFVAKFDTNGLLLWSTLLGGSFGDGVEDIAVTEEGNCYITGRTSSVDFPILNAFDSTYNGDLDVFISKFTAEGSLLWSTFLGGIWWDDGWGIAAAKDGSCFVTGFTNSIDFPIQNAHNSTLGESVDVFVSKFAINGSLLWSTFLGGNGVDRGYDIASTIDGSCFVTGETSSGNFPVKNAFDSSINGGFDAFATKFSSEGFILWSTYLGGSQLDIGESIASYMDNYCYVIGTTRSTDFPIQNAFDNSLDGTSDIFVTILVDTHISSTSSNTVDGYLLFTAIIPFTAFVLTIVIISYKKQK